MTFKRVVFWSHLVVGVATGLVILLLSATGVLLTYERQILRFAENLAVSAPAGRAPLDADAVIAAAQAKGAAPASCSTPIPAPCWKVPAGAPRHSSPR